MRNDMFRCCHRVAVTHPLTTTTRSPRIAGAHPCRLTRVAGCDKVIDRVMDGPVGSHNKRALMALRHSGTPALRHSGTPALRHFRTEKQLTAPADRPVRDPAHAVAYITAIAIGGAGSVHRRTGIRAARALPGDRNRPGSPPATDCRQNPPSALPVDHLRCSADHRPAWRCDAGPDLRRAVGVCTIGRARAARTAPHLTSIAGPRQAASVWHLAGHPVPQKRRCKMILKEP